MLNKPAEVEQDINSQLTHFTNREYLTTFFFFFAKWILNHFKDIKKNKPSETDVFFWNWAKQELGKKNLEFWWI